MFHKRLLLAFFTLGYLVAFGVIAALQANKEFVLYLGVLLVLMWIVLYTDKRAKFPPWILWALSVWGLMHMAGGTIRVPADLLGAAPDREVLERLPPQADSADIKTEALSVKGERPRLYGLWILPNRLLRYDQVVHSYGFYVATWGVWYALRRFLKARGRRENLALYIIIACGGMGLGAANEALEFMATVVFDETGVGGYLNNAMDLMFNAAGAISATVIIWLRELYKTPAERAEDRRDDGG